MLKLYMLQWLRIREMVLRHDVAERHAEKQVPEVACSAIEHGNESMLLVTVTASSSRMLRQRWTGRYLPQQATPFLHGLLGSDAKTSQNKQSCAEWLPAGAAGLTLHEPRNVGGRSCFRKTCLEGLEGVRAEPSCKVTRWCPAVSQSISQCITRYPPTPLGRRPEVRLASASVP